MPRPLKPPDTRTFRDRTIPEIRHAPKTPLTKAESGEGVARRLESLEAELEGTANERQRQRIKESIAATKRAQRDVSNDLEVIRAREALATRPEYLAARALAEQTFALIESDERFHAGYLEAAKRNLQQLRHSLDVEEFAGAQEALCLEYREERQRLLSDFETRRQAIGAEIQLFMPPEPPINATVIPNPGGPKTLYG